MKTITLTALTALTLSLSINVLAKVPYDLSGNKTAIEFTKKFNVDKADFKNRIKSALQPNKDKPDDLVTQVVKEEKQKEVIEEKTPETKVLKTTKVIKNQRKENRFCSKHIQDYKNSVSNYDATSGENLIIPISNSYLNKLVTPFKNVQALSNSKRIKTLRTGKNKNILMVSTKNKVRPISMFLQDSHGNTANATFLPCAVAPQNITIKHSAMISEQKIDPIKPRKKARRWEQNSDYQSKLSELMVTISNGDIPTGYAYEDIDNAKVGTICRTHGLKGKIYQLMEGENMRVAVYLASNKSNKVIQINEKSCYSNKDIMAVSAYPRTRLAPNQFTEVYVVLNKNKPKKKNKARTTVVR